MPYAHMGHNQPAPRYVTRWCGNAWLSARLMAFCQEFLGIGETSALVLIRYLCRMHGTKENLGHRTVMIDGEEVIGFTILRNRMDPLEVGLSPSRIQRAKTKLTRVGLIEEVSVRRPWRRSKVPGQRVIRQIGVYRFCKPIHLMLRWLHTPRKRRKALAKAIREAINAFRVARSTANKLAILNAQATSESAPPPPKKQRTVGCTAPLQDKPQSEDRVVRPEPVPRALSAHEVVERTKLIMMGWSPEMLDATPDAPKPPPEPQKSRTFDEPPKPRPAPPLPPEKFEIIAEGEAWEGVWNWGTTCPIDLKHEVLQWCRDHGVNVTQ